MQSKGETSSRKGRVNFISEKHQEEPESTVFWYEEDSPDDSKTQKQIYMVNTINQKQYTNKDNSINDYELAKQIKTIIPIQIHSPEGRIRTKALIDTGAIAISLVKKGFLPESVQSNPKQQTCEGITGTLKTQKERVVTFSFPEISRT